MPDSNFNPANSAKFPQNRAENHSKSSNLTGTDSLVAAIALRIRQSLDLEFILQQTVTEVRECLVTDRVSIYRFEPDYSGVIAVESANESVPSVFGHKLNDPCFAQKHLESYKRGRIHVINDVDKAKLVPCYKEVLQQFEVKANLVVPIVAKDELWGLLIAHHCRSPRQWQTPEIELLKQLATQVGIAVQQAELYDRLSSLNIFLEQQVDRRTAKLQKSVEFETLTRKVTTKMRDSLDEQQILQTVTEEISQVLNIERCKIELYNSDRSQAEIAYEYTKAAPSCQGMKRIVADFPELEARLLQKQSLQFVESILVYDCVNVHRTRLICPIFDNRGILGNIWLLRPPEECFEADEVILVEQVASQCAIAIRQARLYQQSQIQVEELARLNLLKDDFLKTISHELRTPMSSILLAAETLETLLEREIGDKKSTTFNKVLDIFRSACDRQNNLVSDLLTLCYIDANKEIMRTQWIDLSIWLPQIVEPFIKRIDRQQQTLKIDLPADLPEFKSDISTIERILSELLNNACKYTPTGETICFAARMIGEKMCLSVSNTGVEISSIEQERVFDKFYRIPNRDPWRFGGTGIGLALVKNLSELIGGNIYLASEPGITRFTLELPQQNDSND